MEKDINDELKCILLFSGAGFTDKFLLEDKWFKVPMYRNTVIYWFEKRNVKITYHNEKRVEVNKIDFSDSVTVHEYNNIFSAILKGFYYGI